MDHHTIAGIIVLVLCAAALVVILNTLRYR